MRTLRMLVCLVVSVSYGALANAVLLANIASRGHRRGRKQASRQTRELVVSLKLGVAGPTRLEVATSGVTGRRERQPNAADPENWGRLSLLVAVQCRP